MLVHLATCHFAMPQPEDFRKSHVRVLLPDGMDDGELKYALRSYGTTRLLEIDKAETAFCGWDTRMPGNMQKMNDFETFADELLRTSTAADKVCAACACHERPTSRSRRAWPREDEPR